MSLKSWQSVTPAVRKHFRNCRSVYTALVKPCHCMLPCCNPALSTEPVAIQCNAYMQAAAQLHCIVSDPHVACRHGSGKWQAITTDSDPAIGGALQRRSNVDLKVCQQLGGPVVCLLHAVHTAALRLKQSQLPSATTTAWDATPLSLR